MKRNFKIWHVTSGPFHWQKAVDMYHDGDTEGLSDMPTKANYMVIAMIEEDGKLREEEFWFPEEWQAYKFLHTINGSMEGLEVEDVEYHCEM